MIENELKYVLRTDTSPRFLEKYCGLPAVINQGYLPGKARIRSKGTPKNTTYYFTYKLAVDDVIFEIEKKITHHEFKTLWPHTDRRLIKLRYLKMDGDVQWDIDLFLTSLNEQYFAMAEAEMPETMKAPPRIPGFLREVMLYEVPRERSKEFTSSRVSNPEYAQTLLDAISENHDG